MPKFTLKRVALYTTLGAVLTAIGADPFSRPIVFLVAFLIAYGIDLATSS